MTKKSSSSTRRSASAKSSDSQQPQSRLNRIIGVVAVIVVVALGGIYLVTGSDPFGLFDPGGMPPGVVGSGGDWWQVYFVVPSGEYDPANLSETIPGKLVEHIDKAQSSIDVAAFEFNLTPIAEALIAAHKRGVRVRWVTDDEHGIEADEEPGRGQFAMLDEAGIEIRDDRRSALMHNKFLIFDGQTVWTGSTNLTVNGSFRNNNNVIVIESPTVAQMFEREFAEMWAGQFGPTSPSTVDKQSTQIDGTPIQVLFAAEDGAIDWIIPIVEGARSKIRIMAFSYTHDRLGEAVLQRAKAGVDVRGIFEQRGSKTEYSEMGRLYCAGVPVRQDGNPGTFHHKVILVDDETLITGSLNFSVNADESNDENVVVLANTDIAAQYAQEFERRWAEATDPEKGDFDCK